MTTLCLYCDEPEPFGHIGFEDLLIRARNEGMFFARVENSASEGYCCEVAIWNNDAQQWQRFCWLKCLGGEYPGSPELPDFWTASRFVQDINNACSAGDFLPVIHRMPSYNTKEQT